jgi:hypothetical protein
MKHLVLLFVLANIAAAQKTANVQAETSGTCSPIVQGNQGRVEFTCNSPMDEATRKKFLTLLNAILKNTNDAGATNKKLDSILEYVTHLQVTNSAMSINQQGGITAGMLNVAGMPVRRLKQADKARMLAWLAGQKKDVKVGVGAILSVPDAYDFATDIYNAFQEAGFEMDEKTVRPMMFIKNPFANVTVEFKGQEPPPGELVDVGTENPVWKVITALSVGNIPVNSLGPKHNAPDGVVTIVVGKNPDADVTPQ